MKMQIKEVKKWFENSFQRKEKRRERRKNRHYRIHLYFILIAISVIVGTLIVAALLSYFVGKSLNLNEHPMSLVGWAALFVVLVTTADTIFLSHFIFEPIAKLSHSMNGVAKGDFQLTLQTRSKVSEIRDSYRSFNRMTAELAATETLQTDFISNVSHEFKTPLTAVEGYATLLQDPLISEEERAAYIDKILVNTRRLSELVGNILLLSKAENTAIGVQPKAYLLDEQVREVFLSFEPKWGEREIEFDIDLEEITYVGVESLLYHVFANLLDNAIKFTPKGGMITMRLYDGEDAVTFAISDNGPGIPEEERSRIFRKFYQADSSHSHIGSGLGLALVKQVLDLCRGTIAVTDAQGGGACFTVTLPKSARHTQPSRKSV